MTGYSAANIWNTDQMGFNKELHSTRTLSHVGEKHTLLQVRFLNATTHSYTIQTVISLDGRLIGQVFLCLQEPTGRINGSIGPMIDRTITQASNVMLTCSTSGKLTKTHVRYWCQNVLQRNIREN